MSITLNGKKHPLHNQTPTLSELLTSIGLEKKPVIVELNKTPVLPQNFSKTKINPHDTIEIVALAAGG